jgi:hypothetical protein
MDKTRLRRSLLALFSTTAVLTAACASGPPPGPTPESIAGTNAKVILVAPFNIVSSLPPELEGSTRMVSDALIEHLEAHGKTAHLISFRVGREYWAASMKEVRDSGAKKNFKNAAKVYARKIGEQIEFDAMIVPSIFIQNAKMRSRVSRWDGAVQKMDMIGKLTNNSRSTMQFQTGTLMVRAASIFVHILDRDGNAIQTKRRGLEVIQHLERKVISGGQSGGSDQLRIELVDDNPAIENDEMVRAGVAAVLSPFLSEEIPVAKPDSGSSGDSEASIENADNPDPS